MQLLHILVPSEHATLLQRRVVWFIYLFIYKEYPYTYLFIYLFIFMIKRNNTNCNNIPRTSCKNIGIRVSYRSLQKKKKKKNPVDFVAVKQSATVCQALYQVRTSTTTLKKLALKSHVISSLKTCLFVCLFIKNQCGIKIRFLS